MDEIVKKTIKTGFELISGNLLFRGIKYPKIIGTERLEFVKKNFLENVVVKFEDSDVDNVEDLEDYEVLFEDLKRFIRRVELSQGIISSSIQTKEWRQKQEWYRGGKHNECEIYQRKLLKDFLGTDIPKCKFRLNTETNELCSKQSPLTENDGFEWTEDFDGYVDKYKIYINLKWVCDAGGAQTRTLREVYHFVKTQAEHLVQTKNKVYFINILDGDTSALFKSKFDYLLNKDRYNSIRQNIFVGDMLEFTRWFLGNFSD